MAKTRVTREVSIEWDRLMRIAEKIGKGRCVVIFNEGRPVQVDNIIQKITLDKDEFDEQARIIRLS